MIPRLTRPLVAACTAIALLVSPLPGGGPGATPAAAQAAAATPEQLRPLIGTLGLAELLPILRKEGLGYAQGLADDMFPDRTGARWDLALDAIYDTARMAEVMEAEMAARLDPAALPALTAFFASDLGMRIIQLEISAREALLEDAVDEASRARLLQMRAEDDPRLALLEEFVGVNDLVEMNVVGGLNSNVAFYRGLDAGGAFAGAMSEEEMLADVWGQEPEIRTETEEWVFSYLALAYQPLADAELQAYTELSRTPEGQALNAALFGAFDVLFSTISEELGLAAARMMQGEDI